MTSTLSNGTRRRHPWTLALIAATMLATGLGVGLAIANNADDTTAPPSAATQLANIDGACTNWMMSTPGAANDDAWCSDMTTWMNGQVAAGHTPRSMMWDSPDRLLSSCHAWMKAADTTPPSTTWCSDMVSWMSQHMTSDWNGMMNGSMMGR
jgi:hypothetical protein